MVRNIHGSPTATLRAVAAALVIVLVAVLAALVAPLLWDSADCDGLASCARAALVTYSYQV